MAATKSKLTPRQKLFCTEYLKDFNGRQAVIRAGFTKNLGSAGVFATRLLKNPNVSAELARLLSKLETKSEKTLEDIWREMEFIGFSRIGRCMKNGQIMPIEEMDEAAQAALAGIEEETAYEHFGKGQAKPSGVIKKVKLWDKPSALVNLAKLKFKVAEHVEVNNLAQIVGWLNEGRDDNATAKCDDNATAK